MARHHINSGRPETGLSKRGYPVNDQERQIISDIFARLEQTSGQARDPEAERFIAEKVRGQPYAPYAMAQSLYVQEEAMKSLNAQLEQMRHENEELRQKAGSSGGFLSSIFGGGQARPQAAGSFSRAGGGYGPQGGGYPQQGGGYPQSGPWGGQQQPAYAPQQPSGPWGGQPQASSGGGFLRSAMTTAAGVAGGMVVGNALMNAFSGGHHSTLGSFTNTDMASMGLGDALGGGGGMQDASFGDGGGLFGGGSDAGVQDASFSDGGGIFGGGDAGGLQDASFDDGGGFGGGGDDDSWT